MRINDCPRFQDKKLKINTITPDSHALTYRYNYISLRFLCSTCHTDGPVNKIGEVSWSK